MEKEISQIFKVYERRYRMEEYTASELANCFFGVSPKSFSNRRQYYLNYLSQYYE